MPVNSTLDVRALHANRNIIARSYWKNRFSDFEFNCYFNIGNNALEQSTVNRYSELTFKVSDQLFKKLSRIAESDTSKHIILLSALGILAQRYSFTVDVCIFTPTFREGHNLDQNSGVVPVRINECHDTCFSTFVKALKENVIQDLKHSEYPIEKILSIDTEELRKLSGIGMVVEGIQCPSTFDFVCLDMLFSFGVQDSLTLNIRFNTQKFNSEFVGQIAEHYFNLLSGLIENPKKKISDIRFLSKEEEYQLLHSLNNTEAEYPKHETIITLFEKQVKKAPKNTALWWADKKVSYQELSDQSNRIAAYLQKVMGVNVGDLVGIMLDREEYLLPSIFGILKAGAAYLPIDPNFPTERITSILEDSQLKVLISRSKYDSKSINIPYRTVHLETVFDSKRWNDSEPIEINMSSDHLAYVLYTSGSTGKPKGVMIEHHSVINRILWMQKKYPIAENDVLILKTPITFDVSVWELFWWSFTGASLCVLKPGGERDPQELLNTISEKKVSTIHFVPSMLNVFLGSLGNEFNFTLLRSLRQVFASGEALKPDHVLLFGKTLNRHCNTHLINLYGPTEATVDVSYYECTFDDDCILVPIGRPIDNIKLYVLDKDRQLCAIGVPGELAISGVGLARGYLNNKALTDEKFTQHPYYPQEKLYRTGDLARWLTSGNIEYLRRIDNQVKIRGFRIELGDVENQFASHGQITDTVVIAHERGGDKYLVAYYVADQEVEISELRNYLFNKLPEYMIPSYFIRMENFPLTSNGKLDRKALPNPEITAVKGHVLPTSPIQQTLVKIMSQVLGIDPDQVSINRSFFELGGNSLKVIQLNSIVNETFSLGISIPEMFQYTTVVSLAEVISGKKDNTSEYKGEMNQEVFEMQNVINLFNE